LKVVHTGHSGDVWQAYDDGHQRMVAIKAANESSLLKSLREEFKVGLEIKHARVIEVYNYGIDRGTPFLAIEWFPAPNLKRKIRTKEDREALIAVSPTIVEQAAEGLGWMHSKGWVHRDIKPENFLVNDAGEAKLIDFGLAIRPTSWLGRIFQSKKNRQGTASYIAPEQIRGGALDARADVYSFGCVLHELVAGAPPFTGSTKDDLFSKHLRMAPPPLEAADSNITPDFAKLVRKCLSKDPAARPASGEEVLEEFRKIRMYRVFPRRSAGEAT